MLEIIFGGIFAIIGAIVGSLITYYTQKRTQERTWKRERSLEIAEEVFSPLFGGIKGILLVLEKKWYRQLYFDEWRAMQDDHRCFMVDEKFRIRLDDFSKRIEGYSSAVFKLKNTVLPEIMNEEIKRTFNLETINIPKIDVKFKEKHRKGSQTANITDCLMSKTHPKDHVLRDKTEISNVEIEIRTKTRDGQVSQDASSEKIDEFWNACLRRMDEHNVYKFIIEENDKLLQEARNIEKEIVKRMKEPWKT